MQHLTTPRRRAIWIAAALVAPACAAVNATPPAPGDEPNVIAAAGSAVPPIVPLEPARLWDSRVGAPTVDGQQGGTGRLAAGATFAVQVAGRGGVPADAVAAVVNVTAVLPDAAGFATAYPCDRAQPDASLLNVTPGEVAANGATVPLAADGTLCVFTSAGADFLLDVTGHVGPGSAVATFNPARFLDTRGPGATFDGLRSGGGRVPAQATIAVPIAGRGAVPDGAAAVFVNVTAVDPESGGFVTISPCGDLPNASTLNYAGGQDVANGALAALSPAGELCVYTEAASHLLVDVAGFVPAGTRGLTAIAPGRVADTRPGAPTVDGQKPGAPARLLAEQTVEVPITGRTGVPAGATAAFVNVTIVGPDDAGFVTLFPCGPRPGTSNVNAAPGTVRANNAVAALSAAGTLCVFTNTATDLILDVTGWLEPTDPGGDPGIPGTTTTPGATTTTTTTATPDPGAACARDTSIPQPGDVTVDLVITGKVLLPSGQPDPDTAGHAVVRDRRSNVGAVLGEASVNDAGFFLVQATSNAVPADPGCRDYWIEICAPACTQTQPVPRQFADRDITDLIDAATGQGRQDIDISDDPLEYVFVG